MQRTATTPAPSPAAAWSWVEVNRVTERDGVRTRAAVGKKLGGCWLAMKEQVTVLHNPLMSSLV